MVPDWYEKEAEQLDNDYAAGLIDYDTYSNEMRKLIRDLRDLAEEAARDTYNEYMGW